MGMGDVMLMSTRTRVSDTKTMKDMFAEFDDSDRPGDAAGRSGVNKTDEDSTGRSESDGESPRQFDGEGWTQISDLVMVHPDRGLEVAIDPDGAPSSDARLEVTESVRADGMQTTITRRREIVSSLAEIADIVADIDPEADLHGLRLVDHEVDGFQEFVCASGADPPDVSEDTIDALVEHAYGEGNAFDGRDIEHPDPDPDLDPETDDIDTFELHLVATSDADLEDAD